MTVLDSIDSIDMISNNYQILKRLSSYLLIICSVECSLQFRSTDFFFQIAYWMRTKSGSFRLFILSAKSTSNTWNYKEYMFVCVSCVSSIWPSIQRLNAKPLKYSGTANCIAKYRQRLQSSADYIREKWPVLNLV